MSSTCSPSCSQDPPRLLFKIYNRTKWKNKIHVAVPKVWDEMFVVVHDFVCFLQEAIQQSQRKCEDALYSLLILGARRPVRRLASLAMGKVIAKGDGISIYSRVSTFQGWLVDSKRNEPLSCSGIEIIIFC